MRASMCGVCPVCGKKFSLTVDGVMWHHLGAEREGVWRKRCRGVGLKPKTIVGDDQ